MEKQFITYETLVDSAGDLATVIRDLYGKGKTTINLYGVPRGGVYAALLIAGVDGVPGFDIVTSPEEADVIVDDLIDSGATVRRHHEAYPDKPFLSLIAKAPSDGWLVFPWEIEQENGGDDIPVRLLQYIGEDVKRGGLLETPKRFLKAWEHFTSGYDMDPADVLKTFEDGAENCDEMVLVKNIPLYSQCEHHLVPFFGVAHIAYIPNKKIVGLSKLSRVLDIFARRLQVQERLTNQVATAIQENLDPIGVGVILECRHLCMESRGISQQGHTTVTSSMKGAFMEDQRTRAEFLRLIK